MSSSDWVYSRSEIEVSNVILGRGAFGEVKVAKWRNINIALKALHVANSSEANERDDVDNRSEQLNSEIISNFRSEIELLSRIRHPNIVLFIGVCEDINHNNLAILTELLTCSLYDILEVKKIVLELPDILDISLDIINGLNYLHSFDPVIVHRDISSKNILLSSGNQAKIADLGQAKIFGAHSGSAQSRQTSMPGAMAYSAPEVLTGKYSSKIDIFSFGILLVQMCCGEYPRIDKRENQINMGAAKYPVLETVLNNTVSYQPSERMSAMNICEKLEFIKQNDRFYPLVRRQAPEKDFSILNRHYMKQEIAVQCNEIQRQLDLVTGRYSTAESRWQSEANKVDGLQQTIDTLTSQLDTSHQANAQLTAHNNEQALKIQDLTTHNNTLRTSNQSLLNDKQRHVSLVQFYELQLAQKTNDTDQLQLTLANYQQQLQSSRTAVDQYRVSDSECNMKIAQLKSQLDMQLGLEQTLTRWKEEQSSYQKETAKLNKANKQCGELYSKNEKLTSELKRCEERLSMYEDLPLPDEIKLRFEDMQQDLHRSQSDIQNLLSQNSALQQDNDRYVDMNADKDRQISSLLREIEEKGQTLSEKASFIEDMHNKIGVFESQIREKDQQIQREKSNIASLLENELALTEFLKQAIGEILRQKEHVNTLQKQLQSAPPGTIGTEIITPDINPNQLLDNSIAADFINMLTDVTNDNNSDKPAAVVVSLTLEEIENAESNRRSDATVKYSIQRAAETEGVLGVIQNMKHLYNDSRVQWRCARTIRELVLQSDENKAICYNERIEGTIIKALVTFSDLTVVQSHAMRLLGGLAFGNDLFRRRAGEKGAITCILFALDKHIRDENVILHTLTVLTNLTHNSLENRSRFYEDQGIDALLLAMTAHKDNSKLQRQACWALLTLTASDEVCKLLAENGGDSVIINAMLNHRQDGGVQQYGSWALSNLALSSDEIARKLKKKGVAEVCRIALEVHADNAEVVRQLRHTLGVFAPSNHK